MNTVAPFGFLFKKKKKTREKSWWELHKDVACSFEKTPKAAPNKTVAVRPLTSHLTNYPNKMNKTCWTNVGWSKDKLLSDLLMDSYMWIYQCWPTIKNLTFIRSLCRHLVLSRGLMKSDGYGDWWQERVKRIHAFKTPWWWWWWWRGKYLFLNS